MYLDHTIGELVEYLTTEGWMENSIIVVASDNGGCPSLGGSNYPLRGLKHSYWEGGTKVPTAVRSTYMRFCVSWWHGFGLVWMAGVQMLL